MIFGNFFMVTLHLSQRLLREFRDLASLDLARSPPVTSVWSTLCEFYLTEYQ